MQGQQVTPDAAIPLWTQILPLPNQINSKVCTPKVNIHHCHAEITSFQNVMCKTAKQGQFLTTYSTQEELEKRNMRISQINSENAIDNKMVVHKTMPITPPITSQAYPRPCPMSQQTHIATWPTKRLTYIKITTTCILGRC